MSERRPWEDLLPVERVFELHKEGIARYGGTPGGRADAENCVAGAIGNAWTGATYREPELVEPVLCFTAYVLIYLMKAHCWIDGNKRVAWLSAMEILSVRHLTLDASTDEAESLVTEILTGRRGIDSVVLWITERLASVHQEVCRPESL